MTVIASSSDDPNSRNKKKHRANIKNPKPGARNRAQDAVPNANSQPFNSNPHADSHPPHPQADEDTQATPPVHRNHDNLQNLTHILKDEEDNDYDRIFRLLEAELKRMARYKMKGENLSGTYDGDDLFSEAALKICSIPKSHWHNTEHFLNTFWLIMKRTLINRANHAKAEIRGGPDKRKNEQRLDDHDEDKLPSPNPGPHQDGHYGISRSDLEQVLKKLKQENLVTGKVADLRFFQGYTIAETAAALAISTANVNRRIVYARRFFEWHLGL